MAKAQVLEETPILRVFGGTVAIGQLQGLEFSEETAEKLTLLLQSANDEAGKYKCPLK